MLTDQLKEKTQSLHDSAEHNPFMQKLALGTFTKDDYRALLKIFYRVHHAIESQLLEYKELDMSKRQRLSLLQNDLLCLSSNDVAFKMNLDCDLELKIDTLSKAYGALYVLEGSRMGGRFLTQMVTNALGDNVPISYFNGCGANTIPYIQALKTIINEKELDAKECIQSAKDVFILIDYLFSQTSTSTCA